MNIKNITNTYRQARKGNTELVVVEGVHALKHALRFGAEIVHIALQAENEAESLLTEFGTEQEVAYVQEHSELVSDCVWQTLSPRPPDTGLIALAKKPKMNNKFVGDIVVFIENPHSLFNVGAIIRTAVATGVRSVAISGARHNPWHADCVSTARGLNFALEHSSLITNSELYELAKQGGYTIYAMDTHTDTLVSEIADIKERKILMFGTEREGLSKELCDMAQKVVKLPMREGVSSLNLANSVAATLYSLK